MENKDNMENMSSILKFPNSPYIFQNFRNCLFISPKLSSFSIKFHKLSLYSTHSFLNFGRKIPFLATCQCRAGFSISDFLPLIFNVFFYRKINFFGLPITINGSLKTKNWLVVLYYLYAHPKFQKDRISSYT